MTAIPGQHPHPDSAALSDTVVLRCLLGTVADYPDDPVEWGDLDAIARLWSGDGIREAVLLASPVLAAQVEKLLAPSGTDTPVKKRKRLHKALLKYAIRLSTRRTRFGMCAENRGRFNAIIGLSVGPPVVEWVRDLCLRVGAGDISADAAVDTVVDYYRRSYPDAFA